MPLAYGQVFEDTFLKRIFADQPMGFYVDVGAWHPVKYNVSFPFYLQGWRGICIDPLEHYLILAQNLRPHDTHVQCLVGSSPGHSTLHFAHGLDGLSTTVDKYTPSIDFEGVTLQKRSYPVRTLAEILESHYVGEIDFLKIDVEGAEHAVLLGNDWQRWRPKILVIEATVPGTSIPAWDDWESLVLEQGYMFAGMDTLNRYYVRDDLPALVDGLDMERKPWDEATYLYNIGSPFDNGDHMDGDLARLLGKLLCGGIAANPRLAAQLIAGALDDGENRALAIWPKRLAELAPTMTGEWPPCHDNESLTDYLERVLRSRELLPAVGRFSAYLAR